MNGRGRWVPGQRIALGAPTRPPPTPPTHTHLPPLLSTPACRCATTLTRSRSRLRRASAARVRARRGGGGGGGGHSRASGGPEGRPGLRARAACSAGSSSQLPTAHTALLPLLPTLKCGTRAACGAMCRTWCRPSSRASRSAGSPRQLQSQGLGLWFVVWLPASRPSCPGVPRAALPPLIGPPADARSPSLPSTAPPACRTWAPPASCRRGSGWTRASSGWRGAPARRRRRAACTTFTRTTSAPGDPVTLPPLKRPPAGDPLSSRCWTAPDRCAAACERPETGWLRVAARACAPLAPPLAA